MMDYESVTLIALIVLFLGILFMGAAIKYIFKKSSERDVRNLNKIKPINESNCIDCDTDQQDLHNPETDSTPDKVTWFVVIVMAGILIGLAFK